MEDLLKQMSIEPKALMDHLHEHSSNGPEPTLYDLEVTDEEFKSKSESLMGRKLLKLDYDTPHQVDTENGVVTGYHTVKVEELQNIPMKTIHQTTLKYIYKDCKEDLMQWYQQIGSIPWTLQKQLASDASHILGFYINMEYLIEWIEKIVPVVEILNEKNEKVIQFHDKHPRYVDLYFLLMINYLFTDTYTYESYQDMLWDNWDNGGMEAATSIDFTCPEALICCINENKPKQNQ